MSSQPPDLPANIVDGVEFDAEDSRLIHALAEFTSAASQAYCHIEETLTAQKELLKSQEQLATAVAVSKVGFFDSDLQHQRATFSEQFLADWGLEQGATSEEVYARIHPDDLPQVQRLVNITMETGVPYHAEYRIIPAEGKLLWISAHATVTYGADGQPVRFFGTSLDITELKNLELTLEAVVADLRKERDLRDHFVSALTHDLRTPLAAIKLNGQNIQRVSNDAQVVKRLSQRIIANVERTDQMIQDLLDATRIKAGDGVQVRLELGRLDKIISATVTGLQEIYGPRLKYLNTVGEVDGCWDSASLRRVIENLTNNAFKYGSENTPVTIELGGDLGWILLSIHNKGDPISPEDQKSLFTVYRRTDAALSSRHKGWGIGLALIKGIVMAHAGQVSVSSCSEHGTTFYVRLPVLTACTQLSEEFR